MLKSKYPISSSFVFRDNVDKDGSSNLVSEWIISLPFVFADEDNCEEEEEEDTHLDLYVTTSHCVPIPIVILRYRAIQ